MVAALLQIIAADHVDMCVSNASFPLSLISVDLFQSAARQACMVWVKNRVQTSYYDPSTLPSAKDGTLAMSDREALKASILSLLTASSSRAITAQLGTVLKIIVQRDFPERWPGFLDEVKRMLTSGDARQIAAGCVASLECVRAFK